MNFMKGRNILVKETTLYAIYDRTAGLGINNPVTLHGHQIGMVRDVRFLQNDPQARLLVRMGITEDIPIPSDSRAVIETGLLGSNLINIRLGSSKTMLKNLDTLHSEVATTLQEQFSIEMLPVKTKAESVMLSLDSVLTVIRYVFNEETRHNLSIAMENIRRSIDILKNTTYNIDTLVAGGKSRLSNIFANVESITANIEDNNKALNNIINNLNNISDTIAVINFSRTINNADTAIANFSNIIQKINEGEGTLSKLINDETLYHELESSAAALKELLIDINENPERYVQFSLFGRKRDKDPGEK